ncbi:hypothetical protein SNOG_05680 [Parastagonospora nodorum SN15]|uniref:Uncharacterized protein n=1 Tax=Phaeosphaeria nodorum (strain SN15 / ATCC MYA-4574 / FGSC 10173) TaxID=321614 RepID=Q0URD4_PHANO|nr:hypothetical protein SNOG_05680 [Parastagonospora nodorum SN15]EAT86744.1 hypothetical protein SNOG_05680 [Parastagonospora nodorum SN15]
MASRWYCARGLCLPKSAQRVFFKPPDAAAGFLPDCCFVSQPAPETRISHHYIITLLDPSYTHDDAVFTTSNPSCEQVAPPRRRVHLPLALPVPQSSNTTAHPCCARHTPNWFPSPWLNACNARLGESPLPPTELNISISLLSQPRATLLHSSTARCRREERSRAEADPPAQAAKVAPTNMAVQRHMSAVLLHDPSANDTGSALALSSPCTRPTRRLCSSGRSWGSTRNFPHPASQSCAFVKILCTT